MSNPVNVSVEQQRAITFDAEQAINEFFRHLDDRNYDKLIALIAPSGVWHRQGKELRGPAMVMDAMKARAAGLTTRHLVTNLLVNVLDQDHAEASLYLTVFAHNGDGTTHPPFPSAPPQLVATYRLKLVRTGAGWRFEEITSEPAFRR